MKCPSLWRTVCLSGLLLTTTLLLAACGSGTTPGATATPTPSPSPTPAPSPTPSPTPARITVDAPVHEVDVLVDGGPELGFRLRVVSGLRDGCELYESTSVTYDVDTIRVQVTNTRPADPNIACPAIYGYHEQVTPLEGLEFGHDYTVIVNEETTRLVNVLPPEEPAPTEDMVFAHAPLAGFRLEVMESYPMQYAIVATTIQSNGCIKPAGAVFSRPEEFGDRPEKRRMRVDFLNVEPADPATNCPEVYVETDVRVPMGGGFVYEFEYTLVVNGRPHDFQGGSDKVLGLRLEEP